MVAVYACTFSRKQGDEELSQHLVNGDFRVSLSSTSPSQQWLQTRVKHSNHAEACFLPRFPHKRSEVERTSHGQALILSSEIHAPGSSRHWVWREVFNQQSIKQQQ